jgi:RNA polymerase sigma factor (sigma-70 family)
MSDPSQRPKLELDLHPTRVEQALQKLTHSEREALLLKSREGLSYAEIGALLGLTPAQAEARVASALVKLRARLAHLDRPWWRFWG